MMMLMGKFRFLVLLLVAILLAQNAGATVIDFEDTTPGAIYNVGGSFTTSGVVITAGEFFYLPSGSTTSGYAEIQSGSRAGGTGYEVWTSNINLSFDFGLPCEGLSLQYGDYVGNINLQINGSLANVEDFALLPATLGGTSIFTTPGNLGAMFVIGTINSFEIGGQELAIDNVVASLVPEPATLMLLGSGALWVLTRKRGKLWKESL
jgi:hypothetical protein